MNSVRKNLLPEPIFADSSKGSRLALYRFPKESSLHPPVILTHGTFSNAAICRRLAGFLKDAGFDCWIYEWSGHGLSEFGDLTPDAEDYGLCDVPSVLEKVRIETAQPSCIWVAHSGGGFLPLMYLARNPDKQGELQRLVTMGSQTTGAGKTLISRIRIIAAAIAIRVLGRMPGPLLGLGPEDEIMGFMPQWCRWNLSGKWLGKDDFDYMEAMGKINIPTLCFAGGKDFVAPHEGCYRLFSALNSKEKEFVLCSKENGFSEDYGHPRLIASRNSQNEIWPLILDFIGRDGKDDG